MARIVFTPFEVHECDERKGEKEIDHEQNGNHENENVNGVNNH